jgi:choice-of-anchor C domain-containing protein
MLRLYFCIQLILLNFVGITEGFPQNLIVNGDFETSNLNGDFQTFRVGETFNGWTVLQATVDLNNDPGFAYSGKNSIDLNGTPGVGGIEQEFRTIKGQKYKLSFYLAANVSGYPELKKMRVNVGDQKAFYTIDTKGKNISNMGWELHELTFRATANTTKVQFYSTEGHENPYWGPIIDYVIVTPDKGLFNTDAAYKYLDMDFGLCIGSTYTLYGRTATITFPLTFADNLNVLAEPGFGYHFGVHSLFKAGKLFIRPDIMLNSQSVNLILTWNGFLDANIRGRYQRMVIPLAIGYNRDPMYFLGGIVGHIHIADQINVQDLDSRLSTTFDNFSYGYQLGIGVKIYQVSADIRMEYNNTANGLGILTGNTVYHIPRTNFSALATLSFAIW